MQWNEVLFEQLVTLLVIPPVSLEHRQGGLHWVTSSIENEDNWLDFNDDSQTVVGFWGGWSCSKWRDESLLMSLVPTRLQSVDVLVTSFQSLFLKLRIYKKYIFSTTMDLKSFTEVIPCPSALGVSTQHVLVRWISVSYLHQLLFIAHLFQVLGSQPQTCQTFCLIWPLTSCGTPRAALATRLRWPPWPGARTWSETFPTRPSVTTTCSQQMWFIPTTAWMSCCRRCTTFVEQEVQQRCCGPTKFASSQTWASPSASRAASMSHCWLRSHSRTWGYTRPQQSSDNRTLGSKESREKRKTGHSWTAVQRGSSLKMSIWLLFLLYFPILLYI